MLGIHDLPLFIASGRARHLPHCRPQHDPGRRGRKLIGAAHLVHFGVGMLFCSHKAAAQGSGAVLRVMPLRTISLGRHIPRVSLRPCGRDQGIRTAGLRDLE